MLCFGTYEANPANVILAVASFSLLNGIAWIGSRPGRRLKFSVRKMKFEAIPAAVSDDMDKQRAFVTALVSMHVPGTHLVRRKADFAMLQAVEWLVDLTDKDASEFGRAPKTS